MWPTRKSRPAAPHAGPESVRRQGRKVVLTTALAWGLTGTRAPALPPLVAARRAPPAETPTHGGRDYDFVWGCVFQRLGASPQP